MIKEISAMVQRVSTMNTSTKEHKMGYTHVSVMGTVVDCFVSYGTDGLTVADLGTRDRWGNATVVRVWWDVSLKMFSTVMPAYIVEATKGRV